MKPLWTFIILCFGFSWAVATLIWQLGGLTHILAGALILLFMCGPAFAAVICAGLFNAGRRIEALGLKPGFNLWLVWAWLAAILFVLGALGISLLAPGVEFQNPTVALKAMLSAQDAPASALEAMDMPAMAWIIALQAAVLGAAINGVLLLSEELGWRGWLWDHFRDVGFWKKNAIIGALWGVWHAPLIVMGHNYPGMPVSGPFLFIVFCLLVSPIIGYIRDRNGSVWAASLFHGTLNAVAGVALLAQSPADMPWRGSVGAGGFIMLAVIVGIVYFFRRGSIQ